jgi:hypothetical protein
VEKHVTLVTSRDSTSTEEKEVTDALRLKLSNRASTGFPKDVSRYIGAAKYLEQLEEERRIEDEEWQNKGWLPLSKLK